LYPEVTSSETGREFKRRIGSTFEADVAVGENPVEIATISASKRSRWRKVLRVENVYM
jgi:hypothetical protein